MRMPSASTRIQIGMMWPPQRPNTRSTPRARRKRAITPAPESDVIGGGTSGMAFPSFVQGRSGRDDERRRSRSSPKRKNLDRHDDPAREARQEGRPPLARVQRKQRSV